MNAFAPHFRRLGLLAAFVVLVLPATIGWAQPSPSDKPGGDDGPVDATSSAT